MKLKTLTAILGTLSIGALAAGCATTKTSASGTAPAAMSQDKGAHGSCGQGSCSASKSTGATPTPEKGKSGSCGQGSCSKS
jgi:uncharacterized low-complexity protein